MKIIPDCVICPTSQIVCQIFLFSLEWHLQCILFITMVCKLFSFYNTVSVVAVLSPLHTQIEVDPIQLYGAYFQISMH